MPLLADALARLWPRRGATPTHVKASATGPLIAFETLGRPVWTPRDYAAFAREGFMQNAIVYRSVRMIAEAAASIPVLLYEREEELEEHPLIDLIRRPSPDHTSADFFEAWYGFLLVAGNAYAEAVAAGGRLRELHVLRPDRMKVVPGPDGWPEAYEYTAGGQTVRFDVEPVPAVRPILHVRLFHPANDHYGMSPIEAAASAIDIHNTAARWNKALLDNSARPSGALVYGAAEGRMTAEQFARLKTELEEGFQGAKQAGRPLLLEGGLDWKPLGLSPKDMDFVEARRAAAREIALALGVPPMLLGIPGDNTYSNYQEATRSFWRQTVLPLVVRTLKSLSMWLAPAYGSGLELKADLDQVEALSSEREALWARIDKVGFLTLNEKRAAVGYGPVEGADFAAKAGFDPNQPRVPAGSSDGGQWTDAGGGSGSGSSGRDRGSETRLAQARGGRASGRPRRGEQFEMTTAQQMRLSIAERRAQEASRKVQERDPEWKPRQSFVESAEGAIARAEGEAEEAEARLGELLRDAIPNTSPDWGVTRLTKELRAQGYVLEGPAKGGGLLYRNLQTRDLVRIMERPPARFRSDAPQKHLNRYYYRYKPKGKSWGSHITILDKDQPD
jgi:HK97 family phage portal protein